MNTLTKPGYLKGLIVAMLIFSATVYADKLLEKQFDVQSGGLLTVESDVGSIEVESHGGTTVEVRVYAEKRGWSRKNDINDMLEFEVKQSGDDVRVKAWRKDRNHNSWNDWGKMRVEFIIAVPRVYNVDLHTGGGSIAVGDLEGEVNVETSGGSLSFGRIVGPVKGRTSGGSISLESSKGDAEIHTSGGSIKIGNVDGNINARTSGGSISIDKARGSVFARTSGGSIKVDEVMGDIEAATSGGSVKAYISQQPKGECRLETSGGSVSVYLAKNVGVDIEARASRVSSDFEVDGQEERRYVRGKINGGGPKMYLKTSSGRVNINRM